MTASVGDSWPVRLRFLGGGVVEDLGFLDVVLVHVALRPGVDQLTFRQQAVRCQVRVTLAVVP